MENIKENIGQTKTNSEILNQLYITAEDLMLLIPNLKYQRALDYIKEIQQEMEQKKYFVPVCQKKLALTKLVKKKFGF